MRLVIVLMFFSVSVCAYSDHSIIVKKGCHDFLNETFELKQYVYVTEVDSIKHEMFSNYEFELWTINTSDRNTKVEINAVALKCGQALAHIFHGLDDFIRGWAFMRENAKPSDFIIKYDVDADTYRVYVDEVSSRVESK